MANRRKPYMNVTKKYPALKQDITAYAAGAQATFTEDYWEYLQSVEKIDQAVRIISNIASLAKFTVLRNGKPANIKNIDLTLPNSTDSSVDFLRKLFSTVFTQGAGLIVTEESTRNKRSGKMVNFYNMDVARITIEGGTNLIDNFIYESESGEPVIYKADKCIYINDSIDPSNLIYSLSRLQSLNDVVLMQAGIVNHMKNYFGGGAKDSIIVSTDAPISDKNMKVIKGAFDTFITSSATQSLFLNSKLNVERVSNSMSGSDMLNILKEINVMILEHFGVNAFLSSAFSAGGSGKSEEAKVASRLFFNIHLKPVFRNIELQFTRFFRNTLGITNAEVKFDFSDIDIIADSLLEKTDIATRLLKPGIISVNEARAMIDMPPIDAEAASKHWMPAYLLGSAPVSMEEYDAELERLLQISGTDVTDPATGNGTGTGSSGDEDNTNVVTDQTGRGNTAN